MKITAVSVTAMLAGSLMMAQPTDSPDYLYPIFKNVGGILPLPDAAEQPQENAKVLLDITSDKMTNGVIKGIDRAALISNQYAHAGVGPKQNMKMAIILHGPATKAALTNDAYIQHTSSYNRQSGSAKGNPNLELMKQLNNAGVEIFVCGQALAHRGFTGDEVAGPVRIAVSAATVNINRQMAGFAYLPFD
jgi:hypothetical protein